MTNDEYMMLVAAMHSPMNVAQSPWLSYMKIRACHEIGSYSPQFMMSRDCYIEERGPNHASWPECMPEWGWSASRVCATPPVYASCTLGSRVMVYNLWSISTTATYISSSFPVRNLT